MKVFLVLEWYPKEYLEYMMFEQNKIVNTYSVVGVFSSLDKALSAKKITKKEKSVKGSKIKIEEFTIDNFSTAFDTYSV